jgi:hypothetical protein
MGAMARVAIAGCSLLALAACSGGAEGAAPPTTVTAPSTIASTTVAPSTTSAPTTTLSPQQRDEAEIRDLHDRFYRMLVVTADPPNPDHPDIAATTTGIERQRWTEFVRTMVELGQRGEGDVWGRVRTVTHRDPDHASVLDCHRTEASLVNADGSVAAGHQDYGIITELRMVRTSAGWLVEDWYTGGDQRCEP